MAMPRIAKSFLLIIVVIGLLGGCSGVNKEDQEIIDRSKEIAMKYLKGKYNLDVVITKEKLLPKMAMKWVTVSGYVQGNEQLIFSVSVNYETNEQESFSFNSELEAYLISKGYDPYIRIEGDKSGE
jgi:hypothetical protein|nr:hypothetical protein [Paenibacillus xylanexedens]